MVAAAWDNTLGRETHSTVGPQIAAMTAAFIVTLGILSGALVPAMAVAAVLVVGSGLAHTARTPLLAGNAVALGLVHVAAVVPFLI